LSLLIATLSACVPAEVQHNAAGNDHFAEGAYESAVDEYRLAQVAQPDLAEPYYNAANAYNRLQRADAATALTKQALKTAESALAAQAWYNLGNAYLDGELWSAAIEAYKEALRLDPDDADAKHNLELALERLKQQQEQQQQERESDQENAQQSPGQQLEATPTPEDDAHQSPGEEQDAQEGPQPPAAPEEAQNMTPEQALRLLQALLDSPETLQERLQEIHEAPGPPPKQDW
jgi:Ca-activated chloride channel family protein